MPLRPKQELLELFRRVAGAMANPAEQTRLSLFIVDEAASLLRASGAALLLPVADTGLLRARIGAGVLAGAEGVLFPVEGSFAGAALLAHGPISTPDLSREKRTHRRVERTHSGPACAVPLRRNGRASAVLLMVRPAGSAAFEPGELDLVTIAAEGFAAALAATAQFADERGAAADSGSGPAPGPRPADGDGWHTALRDLCRIDRRVPFRWDPATGTFEWDTTLHDVFGFGALDFGENLNAWLGHVREQDQPPVRALFQVEPGANTAPALAVCLMRHRSGVVRRVAVRLAPASETSGTVRIGTITDVTDEDRSAEARDAFHRGEPLAQIVRALRHEINGPLAAAISQLQRLERDHAVASNPALLDAIRRVYAQTAPIGELVRRLAALERPPEGPPLEMPGIDGVARLR